MPGGKDLVHGAPRVTSACNPGPIVAGRLEPPPAGNGCKGTPIPSLHESYVTGVTESVWSTNQRRNAVLGASWCTLCRSTQQRSLQSGMGLTGEIAKTGLSRPPRWNEATGVITPQGAHPTPVRPPVLRTPLPVSYLEEGPLERVVLGRGMCPPIPRAKLSHPVCLSKVDSGMLWERVTCPLDVCRVNSRLIQGVYMHICQAPLKSGPHPSVSLGGPARPTGPRTASADWSARWLVGPI